MDAKCRGIRDDILSDMRSIKRTLNNCASVIRAQKGVGCEFCADKLETVARRYDGYIRTISNMN